MKHLILVTFLSFCAVFQKGKCQEISNVKSSQEGNIIVVTYDLKSTNNKDLFYISLHYSIDRGNSFSPKLENVNGDVGANILSGVKKRIEWNALSYKDPFIFENIIFIIKATPLIYSFIDTRDNRSYKFTVIGNQTWMAENLKYKPSVGSYWIYDNNNEYLEVHGYLYDWEAAKSSCPTGWRLPTDADWKNLIIYIGETNSGDKLKSNDYWQRKTKFDDNYNFKALPSGRLARGNRFEFIRENGYWWTSSELNNRNAYYRIIYNTGSNIGVYNDNKGFGFSVRCIKEQ